jgi:hypothetical protein
VRTSPGLICLWMAVGGRHDSRAERDEGELRGEPGACLGGSVVGPTEKAGKDGMNDWCGEPVAVFVLGHDCSGFRLCKNAKGRGEGFDPVVMWISGFTWMLRNQWALRPKALMTIISDP